MHVLCRGDLIRILTKLLRRRSKLDHIIIETTGLADPGPVIQTFFTGMCFSLLIQLLAAHHFAEQGIIRVLSLEGKKVEYAVKYAVKEDHM